MCIVERPYRENSVEWSTSNNTEVSIDYLGILPFTFAVNRVNLFDIITSVFSKGQ